jgi:uncharacterized protein YbjT (DUF2867 family)
MSHTVLLTGATGYVGGRLLHRLEERGDTITCLARTPDNLEPRCKPTTRIVKGDVISGEGLDEAMQGVDVAYFLVHSMGTHGYHKSERQAARNFAAAAERAGVKRIVYLGALGRGKYISRHLESRQEVGRILRSGTVPAIEFRSSVIIGSGSLSFEMVRALVDRLPVMVWPKWVDTPTQPIGVEDVIDYLLEASEIPLEGSEVVEIGGTDQVSYGQLLIDYGKARGLRRYFIRVPVLTPRLSSLWLGLVTPVYARIGRELVEGLRAETVVTSDTAERLFSVKPMGMKEQIARALSNEDREFAETKWSDAVSSRGQEHMRWGGARKGNRLVDSRSAFVPVPPEIAFAPIQRIGGDAGWYHADYLWDVRGFLDLAFGGAGMRRGRRDPEQLVVGDTVDFWRVEEIQPGHLLRMKAEMALPGRAWLQYEVREVPSGSMIHQTALFDPTGVFGRVYWYFMWPFHQFVFGGTLRSICRLARDEERQRDAVVTTR